MRLKGWVRAAIEFDGAARDQAAEVLTETLPWSCLTEALPWSCLTSFVMGFTHAGRLRVGLSWMDLP